MFVLERIRRILTRVHVKRQVVINKPSYIHRKITLLLLDTDVEFTG